ncbi:hypothetical protein BGZ65_011044 [Modicella reniformis]|uniref:Peptidase A1 domain-containing protein n=1 Tax=Modicella reniformis TaxID=1440133 RepID=A0A9P6IRY8_9FUNG|nr:hypothetical protein BGZ65_011044 [Modicella reniformis]
MTTLEVPGQSILVVDQAGLHLTKSYGTGVDGIIGLNLRSPVIESTVIQNIQKTEIAVPVATAGKGGELLLNAVDKSRFCGPIRWSNRGPSPYDWSVLMDRGIQLHDPITDTTFFTVPETDRTFSVLDSGSDGIYLRRPMYHALYERIPGAMQLPNGFWRVPCRGITELVFGIEEELYRIPYEDWVKKPNMTTSSSHVHWGGGPGMCQAKVYGSSPGPILLGAAFLRTVYTVFDFSRPGHERVGFAALA